MYLNSIYFGSGCYGLEKASNYYFNKNASDLSVGESAMLAGVIKAPTNYNPIKQNKNAEERKKIVLKLMLKNRVIDDTIYKKSAKTKENVVKTHQKQTNIYLNNILNEACSCLSVAKNKLKNMNLTIETSIDSGLQTKVEEFVNSDRFTPKNSLGNSPDAGVIVVDNKNKSIVSVASTSNIDLFKNKRQPGSLIKPLLVYASAFENRILYPESMIIDEPINIDGYKPSNANKKFSGLVSIRDSINKSLNIPAVKTLSRVGVERAKNFSKKLGLTFNKNDRNLALALGGMTDGLSLKQLADAYSTFATNGGYCKSGIIKKIVDKNGSVLYEKDNKLEQVMSVATSDIITDLLCGVTTEGTARRLNSLKYEVASKTGTVGLGNSTKNTDAYNVAYTKEFLVVSWIGSSGDDDYMDSFVNGSTYPTLLSKTVLNELYKNYNPEGFKKSENVVYKYIDLNSLKF